MLWKQLCLCVLARTVGASFSTPVRAPAYPLAVRSPYLSTWVKGSHDGTQDRSPEFWNGQPLGWTGLVRINETVYSLFGAFPAEIACERAHQISQSYTPSKSSFRFDIAGLIFELIFSNPLTPRDYKRQTLPLSYLEVLISAFDHVQNVDLYFDINGAWLSGDQNNFISWDLEKSANSRKQNAQIVSHVVRRTSQLLFTEIDDMAEWGSIYWSTDDEENLTYSGGFSTVKTRKHFERSGNLTSRENKEYRPINLDEPVFAFAKKILPSKKHQSVLFTIGLVQEQVLQVNLTQTGYKVARPLYQRYFDTIKDMISWHYLDYKHNAQETFADMIVRDAKRIDENYASITAISAVQAIGGTQLVINEDDPKGEPHLWMKEISSDGNMQTSDVMYPAFPFFLYANPKLAVAMLEPLLIHQEAGLYPHKYAMHDMGSSYPNATGHADGNDEYMPVEECGNNLIMMLAAHDALIAVASGKEVVEAQNWLKSHYDVALQWTQYLIDYGLIPELQLSTDDFAGRLTNQTNLAVKAIVGIKSMAVIAQISGYDDEASRLASTVDEFLKVWLALAYEQGIPYAKLAYQWKGSWGSLYNLYGDVLLDLKIFPRIVYQQQDSWYLNLLEPYGLPLDSRHLYTKSDWQMFIASFSTPALYTQLYHNLAVWVNETEIQKPLIDLYDTIDGRNAVNMFTNRPVVGGHFAHLALELLDKARSAITRTRLRQEKLVSTTPFGNQWTTLSRYLPRKGL